MSGSPPTGAACRARPTRITNSIRAPRFAQGEMTQAQLAEVFQVPLDAVFQHPVGAAS